MVPASPAPAREHTRVEITDPKAIRALAHAARLEVISELYATQASRTATELAAQTGLTPSAMSYHLRALQKWGIVAPGEATGDARERRWKAAGTDFAINSGGAIASPGFAVLDLELEAFRRRATAYAASRQADVERMDALASRDATPAGTPTKDEVDASPAAAVVLASNLLYLTPAQRTELRERLIGIFREYELTDHSRIPDGAQRMATMWSMIPDDRPRNGAPAGR